MPPDGTTDAAGRCLQQPVAQQAADRIRTGREAQVLSVETERVREAAPLPFDLGSLQEVCSRQLGLDVQETLDIAQSLYETHKATTYPRSDSGYLPESMLAEVPAVLDALLATDPSLRPLIHQLDRTQAPRQDVLVGFVAQRFDHAARDRQRCAAGRFQVGEARRPAAGDQFLQGLELVLVLFLDQGCQAHARNGHRLGAGLAGALLLFAQHAHGPCCSVIGGAPGLAGEIAVAVAGIDAGGVGHIAPVQKVVPAAHDIADDANRALAGATGAAAAHPRNTVVPAIGLGLVDGRDRIGARDRLPDDYTLVTYRSKPAADGPRYKAIGNSMAVPCIAWLGDRLLQALT